MACGGARGSRRRAAEPVHAMEEISLDEAYDFCSLPEMEPVGVEDSVSRGEGEGEEGVEAVFQEAFVPSTDTITKPFAERTPFEIFWTALRRDHPEVNFVQTRRRVTTKGYADMASERSIILEKLLREPQTEARKLIENFFVSFTSRRKQEENGRAVRNVFDRRCAEQAGTTIRSWRSCPEANEAWSKLDAEDRSRWLFLTHLHNDLFKFDEALGRVERIPFPAGVEVPDAYQPVTDRVFGPVPGLMITLQLDAFMATQEIKDLGAAGGPLPVLIGELRRLDACHILQLELGNWAKEKCREIGGQCYSWGIEACARSQCYGRCHAHVMISTSCIPHMHPWARPEPSVVSAKVRQLTFRGKMPHVSVLKSKNGKGWINLVQHGHYYVQGPKEGQVACFGEDVNYGEILPLRDRRI